MSKNHNRMAEWRKASVNGELQVSGTVDTTVSFVTGRAIKELSLDDGSGRIQLGASRRW